MTHQPALTWWLTGLPGSGKTTLALALSEGEAVCILDGDALRAGVCADLGFSEADRERNVTRVAHLARLLNAQGLHAVGGAGLTGGPGAGGSALHCGRGRVS